MGPNSDVEDRRWGQTLRTASENIFLYLKTYSCIKSANLYLFFNFNFRRWGQTLRTDVEDRRWGQPLKTYSCIWKHLLIQKMQIFIYFSTSTSTKLGQTKAGICSPANTWEKVGISDQDMNPHISPSHPGGRQSRAHTPSSWRRHLIENTAQIWLFQSDPNRDSYGLISAPFPPSLLSPTATAASVVLSCS